MARADDAGELARQGTSAGGGVVHSRSYRSSGGDGAAAGIIDGFGERDDVDGHHDKRGSAAGTEGAIDLARGDASGAALEAWVHAGAAEVFQAVSFHLCNRSERADRSSF